MQTYHKIVSISKVWKIARVLRCQDIMPTLGQCLKFPGGPHSVSIPARCVKRSAVCYKHVGRHTLRKRVTRATVGLMLGQHHKQ